MNRTLHHHADHPSAIRVLSKAIFLLLLLCGYSIWTAGAAFAQSPAESGQVYFVQRGDSLTKIARNVFEGRITADEIYAATNAKSAIDSSFARLRDPNVIVAGQKLWIPDSSAPASNSEPTAPPAATPPEPMVAGPALPAPVERHVLVRQQPLGVNNTIVLDEVATDQPSNIAVVHTQEDASERIVGRTSVGAGVSANLTIGLTETVPVGSELVVMLTLDESTTQANAGTAQLPPIEPVTANFRIGLAIDQTATQELVTVLDSTANWSVLAAALKAAGLADELRGAGPYTFFAPANDAFAALSEERLELLLSDAELLREVLEYHIIPGHIEVADLIDAQTAIRSASGSAVTLQRQGDALAINDAPVLIADVPVANGVLHLIDVVLFPASLSETLVAQEAATQAVSVRRE